MFLSEPEEVNMGSFWDAFDDSPLDTGDGDYARHPFVTGGEKQQLIAAKTSFFITGVRGPVETKFGKSYFADALVDMGDGKGEERTLGFKAESVPSRDRLLEALKVYLGTNGNAAPEVYLEQVKSENGNTPILIRAASA
jgi:hypothetical protein